MRPSLRTAVLCSLLASTGLLIGQVPPTDSLLDARAEHVRLLREKHDLPGLCDALMELGALQEGSGHMKEARALYAEAILLADTNKFQPQRVDARLRVARWLMGARQNALAVLLEARAIADTAGLYTAALEAERLLVRTYAGRGDSAAAGIAFARGIIISDTLSARAMRSALAEVNDRLGSDIADRSADVSRTQEELRRSQEEGEALREAHRSQLLVIVGAAVVLLLAAGFILYRSGRSWRARVVKLEQEVAALRPAPVKEAVRPRERVEPAVTVTAPPLVLPAVDPVPPVAPTQENAVLAAFLARMLPERMRTLQEARGRGDREKMLRVVRSLRPQLVHHDAQRFERLCEELLKLDPADRSPVWDEGFDRFTQALELLQAGGSRG